MFDPWAILGVAPGASAQQIHAAWRRGVSQWHPDRNASPDATRRLQEINAAFASLRGSAAPPAGVAAAAGADAILSGLSGTVFGEPYSQAGDVASDCMRFSVEVAALDWLQGGPITLAVPCIAGVFTLLTLLQPARLHDGSMLVFRRAGLSPDQRATDLLMTIRIALPAMPRPTPVPLQRCA